MKAVFNEKNITHTADLFATYCKQANVDFNKDAFLAKALSGLDNLELKQRSEQIYSAIKTHLPDDYRVTTQALLGVLQTVDSNQDLREANTDKSGVAGWIIMPFAEYVGRHGKHDFEYALTALAELTQRFTSEFGIRYLLLNEPEKCLPILLKWTKHDCHHVRRLVSEGTRPLLPWAMQLPNFKAEPLLALPLLEALKDDESEYVRRSVANHFNDISKDHPDVVTTTMARWLSVSNSQNTLRMVKHACRSLIKKGNEQALALFGYHPPKNLNVNLNLSADHVELGENVLLSLTLSLYELYELNVKNRLDTKGANAKQTKPQPLLIDYQVYHLRGRGQYIKKVFKWKELLLASSGEVVLEKSHSFKPINTRRYYSGTHFIEVLINGKPMKKLAFELDAKESTSE